jgi:lysozyme
MVGDYMIIDVSRHNGNIDWKKVKAAGITGAIVRCGYGDNITSQDDEKFIANMNGALAYGIGVGIYIYSYAKNNAQAKSEAEHVLRLANTYKDRLSYPIYYDLEEKGTESGAKERAIVFGDIIEAAGYWCGVYASESWWKNYLNGLDRFTKWVAKYGSNNGRAQIKPSVNGMDMWQYTSKGEVSGINGYVDLNIAYKDLPALIARSKKKSADEIAREVIAGKWGNGEERRKRLEAAGYSYSTIQAIVNQILR